MHTIIISSSVECECGMRIVYLRASRVQVCDWYATLTNLVGVNSSDNLHIADGPFLKPCLSLSSSPYLWLALRFCVCCIHPLLLLTSISISLLSFSLSFVCGFSIVMFSSVLYCVTRTSIDNK